MTDQDKTALLSKLRAPVASLPSQTRWPVLRAMSTNYTAGKHVWDALDAQACAKGAEEIKQLRAAISALASAPTSEPSDTELRIGVSATDQGATICIMRPHTDGTITVIYTETHPLGDSVGRAALARGSK
ncbi:hypothetical protein [Achromobacter denitrificans]|uniref:Uncharacterized protein n=1 Tax=Achromobacter denitrificans TaxID=32002 RepID=A0ABZ3G6C4_ACHDE